MFDKDRMLKKVCRTGGEIVGGVFGFAGGALGGTVVAAKDLWDGKSLKEAGKSFEAEMDNTFCEAVDEGGEIGEEYGPKAVKGAVAVGKAYMSYKTYQNYKKSEKMLAQSRQKQLGAGS